MDVSKKIVIPPLLYPFKKKIVMLLLCSFCISTPCSLRDIAACLNLMCYSFAFSGRGPWHYNRLTHAQTLPAAVAQVRPRPHDAV